MGNGRAVFYFGDGSGGVYTKYPSLRRCGVGVTKLSEETEAINFSVFYPLPGSIQTVAKAEAHAFSTVCEQVSDHAF